MEQNTALFPNIVRSLDKLKILVFWEILKTHNPFLLDINHMPDKIYTDEEKNYVIQVWEILWDSYFQLKNDGKSKIALENSYEQMLLAHKINILQKNIDMCKHLKDVKHLLPETDYINHKQMLLSLFVKIEPKVKIKYFDTLEDNINIVNKILAALQNKYNKSKEDNEKEVSKQVDNVYSVIARVSRITNMQLNAQNMMVTEWLAYEQQAKEIVKAEESRRKNKK